MIGNEAGSPGKIDKFLLVQLAWCEVRKLLNFIGIVTWCEARNCRFLLLQFG